MPLALDLDTYAARGERFISEMDREYYLHFAGHKEAFEIEEIYDRHARPVRPRGGRGAAGAAGRGRGGEQQRRCRYLLELAVGGLIGRETKCEAAELAEREAALEIEVDGEPRAVPPGARSLQANEPDPDRRAAIEVARLDVLERS